MNLLRWINEYKKPPPDRRSSGGGGIAIRGGCGNIPMWTRLADYSNTYLIDKPNYMLGARLGNQRTLETTILVSASPPRSESSCGDKMTRFYTA